MWNDLSWEENSTCMTIIHLSTWKTPTNGLFKKILATIYYPSNTWAYESWFCTYFKNFKDVICWMESARAFTTSRRLSVFPFNLYIWMISLIVKVTARTSTWQTKMKVIIYSTGNSKHKARNSRWIRLFWMVQTAQSFLSNVQNIFTGWQINCMPYWWNICKLGSTAVHEHFYSENILLWTDQRK